jgi:hypothetical protein
MANTFKNANLDITSSEQTLYTCPASTTAVVISLRITNVDGANTDNIKAEWVDSDGTTKAYLAYEVDVPFDSILELAGDSKIVLEASDSIKLTGGAASGDLEAFASILEIT